MYVTEMTERTHLISQRLGLYQLPATGTAGRMACIKGQNTCILEEFISLYIKDEGETVITADKRQVDHGKHVLAEY